MMQLCGTCAQQAVQAGASVAPTLWFLALAAITVVSTAVGKKKGKGK